MLEVRELHDQLYTEVSWLSREKKGTSFDEDFKLTSCLPIMEWEGHHHRFGCALLQLQFCRYDDSVAMSWVKVPNNVCQSFAECIFTRSFAYANFLEIVAGRSCM